MHGPPPPWFFIVIFPVMAASAGIVIRSIGAAIAKVRGPRQPVMLAPQPDPQVARLQAEVDELRTQLERLSAAESFYAQLQAPAGPPRG
ncbi:MAG TPA: hypothetical protein VF771_17370 [Longimicrobiaceae bacterium]